MTEPLTYADFNPPGVTYGFFTRKGGVSSGTFASLNLKRGTGDDDAAVAANYSSVCHALGVAEGQVTFITQTHGNICHITDQPLPGSVEGDALVTTMPGLAIAILTADCAPVLLYGTTADGAPIVGAAHAGWGGALKGILEATLDAMEKKGANRRTIQAAIGPCIGRLSYEVSPEFLAPFLADAPESEKFFMAMPSGKYLFDLPAYCRFRLNRAGVQSVVIGGQDTYKETESFFSYRRDTKRGVTAGGRQISAICIRSS